jgi:hypothetical protein
MSKWIDVAQAAAVLDMDLGAFKRICRSSNPPPFIRPSERHMLFDADSLRKWQQSWVVCENEQHAK